MITSPLTEVLETSVGAVVTSPLCDGPYQFSLTVQRSPSAPAHF